MTPTASTTPSRARLAVLVLCVIGLALDLCACSTCHDRCGPVPAVIERDGFIYRVTPLRGAPTEYEAREWINTGDYPGPGPYTRGPVPCAGEVDGACGK